MRKCFDWDKNILNISDTNGNSFNLKFKDLKTIVTGASASGKSLLCSIIHDNMMDLNDEDNKVYDTSNIVLLDKTNMHYISSMKDKLIVIDRTDLTLDKEAVEMINMDWGTNKYLIFSRKPLGIDLSPNYYAELEKSGNEIRLTYLFNEEGWN